MQLIRGTTPTIVINVKDDIDLSTITEIWVYISQQNKVKVDKKIEDVDIDDVTKTITLTLSQEDTLSLKSGEALFQIRLLLQDDTALATTASEIEILEIYKGGIISDEDANP